MKRILGLLMAFILCLGVFTLVGGVNVVKAAEGDIASGTYDGVSWRITSDGELILGNGGMQTMTNRDRRSGWSYPWWNYDDKISSIRFDGKVIAQGSLGEFIFKNGSNWLPNIKKIDFTGFDTSRVTNMRGLVNCRNLTELIGLETLDTSSCTDMSYMFFNCRSLKNIDVSNFDTSKVTTMFHMFCDCSSLESLDMSHFDTRSVATNSYPSTDAYGFQYMFTRCSALKKVILG